MKKERFHLITIKTSSGCEKYLVCGSKTAKERWLKQKVERLTPRLKGYRGYSGYSISTSTSTWFGISDDFKLPCPCACAYAITTYVDNTFSTKIVKNKRNALPSGLEMLKRMLFTTLDGEKKRSFRTPVSLKIEIEPVEVINLTRKRKM